NTAKNSYGIAFDIGTTTVAGSLVDLNAGRIIATRGATNYQQIFGADVISRIDYSITHENGAGLLQKGVMAAMDEIITGLTRESGITERQIYESVVVGNTTMIHLFMGLDASFLARSPFVPVFSQALNLSNKDFGLGVHPAGNIHILPSIAGFVGADTVAVMLATEIEKQPGISLVVDIGTNGEIVLAGGDRILTCSTAAGPAFEGAKILYGMRAVNGAIEGISIDEDVHLDVIGGGSPKGICGSGLIDAVAEMLRVGILDSQGRIADREALMGQVNPKILDRIQEGRQGREFVLNKSISSSTDKSVTITQKDIRELQLAKGAICAGIRILLEELELTPREIDRVFMAGAFGNYIKRDSAVLVGLFPEIEADRIYPVGNAAGVGACMALTSIDERKRATELALKAEHIELSCRKDFQEEFLNAIYFPVQS
ncbi:MAG: ASKHA domain-containing protein, partial [Methanosarcinaceae archaeon]|nr:ASKHA domain-containing protein [Methanosarcinaceae archaeon]